MLNASAIQRMLGIFFSECKSLTDLYQVEVVWWCLTKHSLIGTDAEWPTCFQKEGEPLDVGPRKKVAIIGVMMSTSVISDFQRPQPGIMYA